MARGGLPRDGGTRQRTCLGCRAVKPKDELARLCVSPGGLVLDDRQALPGRGAYTCRSGACTAKAARLLPKALRSPGLAVSPDLLQRLVAGEAVPVPEFEARPPDDEPVG